MRFPAVVSLLSIACAGSPASRPSVEPAPIAAERVRRGYTAADVEFMQRMIGHHDQALAMTALVPARTARIDLRLVAERIEVSQRDEIELMKRWLLNHAEALPDSGAGSHAGHGGTMPGMLSPAQMARLASSSGVEFERLFLESMIRHHEGAVMMVAALLGSRGAGQDPAIFSFAADVDADQRAEIARMRALLAAMPDE